MEAVDLVNPPSFFALTPSQFEWLLFQARRVDDRVLAERDRELVGLRLHVGELELRVADLCVQVADPYRLLRKAWKDEQEKWPDAPRGFIAGIRQAFQRGHEWGLSVEEWETLRGNPCSVCGGGTGNGVGLDRLDNRRGYFVDNVRPCCGPCNLKRGRKLI